VGSTRPDTTVVVTLTDVAPDGTSDRVTAGSQVASLGAFIATPCGARVMDCSVFSDGVPVVPWHPYTRASQQLLTSGTPVELKVEIFPTSLVVRPGHRLRVSLTTGDLPHQGPNLSTLANSTGGVDTFYFGGERASAVYLGAVTTPRPPPTGPVAASGGGTTLPNTAGGGTALPAGLCLAGLCLVGLSVGLGPRRRGRRSAPGRAAKVARASYWP
jgi:hypothetical protein